MFKKIKPLEKVEKTLPFPQFPHCDQRILHAPGECQHCDYHGEWQALRIAWGICFTGFEPEANELPCPADYVRGDSHKLWGGNIAKPKDWIINRKPGSGY